MGRELLAFGKASLLVGACGLTATALVGTPAKAQEAPECRSTDPSLIPAPSKPYFMVVVDTSSSMLGCASPDVPALPEFLCDDPLATGCNSCPDVAPDNSCGLEPTRLNSAKCALRKTVQAFAGEVNFGLETYPFLLSSCPAGACADSCTNADGSCDPPNFGSFEGEFYGCTVSSFTDAETNASCGNTPNCGGTLYPNPGLGADWRNGGSIAVDLLQDRTWDAANQPPSNVSELLSWFDNDCSDNREIFALGATPLEGSLRSAHQYLAQGWDSDWGDTTFCDGDVPNHASPLDASDRPCRSLNIILVTDGDETCGGDPSTAALDLYNTGVTNGGTASIPVRTHVIGFAGVPDPTSIDAIADAGDDGVLNASADALVASNETDLAQALATIIGGSINPEICDNVDNNCNGCTDELYQVYCNRSRTPTALATLQTSGDDTMCCSWTNDTERQACLDEHASTITGANPAGDRWFLPCWDPEDTATYGTDPTANWLCTNPGDVCDEADNNCELTFSGDLTTNTTDENQKKCGNPLHCPIPETCNDEDDNCDGVIDNDPATPGTPYSLPDCFQCQPQDEICDGCDNDNDGTVDGFSENCALAPTPECFGTRLCPEVAGPSCDCSTATGNSFAACDVSVEHDGRDVTLDDTTCDQFDDDCDGVRDEDAAPTDCFYQGNSSLYYGPESTCELGLQACNSTVCVGAIGPGTEICNGTDDDCDGFVDGRRPGGTLVACNPLDATSCDAQGANSFCAEDLIEGLGNSYCVLPALGIGGECGTDSGTCTKGTIQCVGGTPVCTGGNQPQPEDCNGIDDDCDTEIDEGTLADAPATTGCWNEAGTTCSHEEATWGIPAGTDATCDSAGTLVAPCRVGTLSCSSGAWVCVGPKAPAAEVCDGVDNDCDGTPDDGTGGGVCGTDVGICTSGTFECIDGVLTCNGTNPQTEVCNGLDDDCDGQDDLTDPDVLGEGEVCGTDVGACQSGVTECIDDAGTWRLDCQGEIGETDEVCNGIDDNCNGQIDEAPTDAPADLGCWNFTTGANTCSAVGLAWDPPPGGTCTGLGSLTSPCAPGVLVCTGGTGWECQGGTVPVAETCDGLDNNCDGTPDDNNPGGGGTCGTTDVGECSFGTLNCVSGGLVCQGEQGPTAEICDGLDNDCNGTDDDNITTGIGNPCGFSTGVCERGVTACVSGSIQCTGGVNPGDEICNGLDDDCDGLVDEDPTDAPADDGCWSPTNTTSGTCSAVGLFWEPADPSATCTTAGTLSTPCTAGTLVCVNGAWGCQGSLPPSPEVCDGVDNNCDGTPDEGDPGGGAACSTDVGACEPGTLSCVSGSLVCSGGTTATAETCNNVDDDCDGFIDGTAPPTPVACDPANGDADCASEGVFSRCVESQLSLTNFFCVRPPSGYGGVCGTSLGACEQGVLACIGGAPVCLGEVVGSGEVCNGVDDDCNGVIDDALTDAPAEPGCWDVAGTTCSFDSLTWDPPTGGTCTGLGTLTSPCFTGNIVCDGVSGWTCQGGRLPAPEVCDGVDNDCNGQSDDGDPGGGASCGSTDVGACSLGTETCDTTIGQVVCSGEVTAKTELCDGLDNDCDGFVDATRPGGTLVACDPANGDADCTGQDPNTFCAEDLVEGLGNYYCVLPTPGTGKECGGTTGACSPGSTVCIGGTLVCQGGVQPVLEECDGVDNDCDGSVDEGTLSDAPTVAECWNNAGTTCSYEEATWDPPLGGNCTDLGTLQLPCSLGFLQCNGSSGWACTGGTLPVLEVCDGIDNNCDGTPDDGNPGGGAVCGDSTGACEEGIVTCISGTLQCDGEVGPAPEVCDGVDNDCDGTVDDGITLGEPCSMTYDTTAFPGVRSPGVGICRAGVTDCDPAGTGAFICIDGQGPEPEVCDGLDNDCDGVIDEVGPAPDGITGTADPNDPTRFIGDNCGTDIGECDFGQFICRGGRFVCEGAKVAQREICDCLDNDCDGSIDELAGDGEPSLCSDEAVCATLGGVCQCAEQCRRGEFPCGTGTVCERQTSVSGSDSEVADVCWDDPCPGGCETKTVTGSDGSIECGPAGTLDADGNAVPVCRCSGADGCHGPCYRVQCNDGFACVPTGQFQGTCRADSDCRFFGCNAGEACVGEVCVDNPCDATTCGADEVCKPNEALDGTSCVGSCMDVTCGAGEVCRDGACEATGCGVDCPEGEVCLPGSGDGGAACGENPCSNTFCVDGSYCEPTTGACIQNPCAGVICPTGGVCQAGQCVRPDVTAPPDAGAGGTGGTGGAGGSGATVDAGGGTGGSGGGGAAGSGNRRGDDDSDDVIGLATGGGGCRCDVPANKTSSEAWLLALLAMGAFATRRGARKEGGAR